LEKDMEMEMPIARVLIVDDEKLVAWSFKKELSRLGYNVDTAYDGQEAMEKLEEDFFDLILLDLKLPDISGIEVLERVKKISPETTCIMITAYGDVNTAVQAMRLGAHDFMDKGVSSEELIQRVQKALEETKMKREVIYLREFYKKHYGIGNIIGVSPQFLHVLEIVEKLSSSNVSVLILGESGTGKEVIARLIHQKSPRANCPFMDVNCSALPETLLESELFGHERGAFTDAKEMRKGLFEIAQGGTIFLDEIGDMPLSMQPKILRAIEAKEIRRLGSSKNIRIDVRIIAASNKNIEQMVKEGKFREDLYYRLNTFQITIPPLRERKEDIAVLANHFISSFSREYRTKVEGISEEAMAYLERYHWPGNIRELRNVLERAIIMATEEAIILPHHLPVEITKKEGSKEKDILDISVSPGSESLPQWEKAILKKTMEIAQGNQSKAARMLGISRYTLRYRLKKFGLMPNDAETKD